jgi:uncharacterized MAPEG superfamily protein
MSMELKYLTWTALFTALMWIPYILNAIVVRGLIDTVGYPENPKPLAPWASRMKAAHYNAIENLAVFAALVLIAEAAGIKNGVIAAASATYFWARVVHFFVYTFRIPWLRTLAFAVGFACQVVVAWQILS